MLSCRRGYVKPLSDARTPLAAFLNSLLVKKRLRRRCLVRHWQPQLVPHMQTRMLQHLKDHPQPWSDLSLIEQELASREQRIPSDRSSLHPKDKIKA